MFRQFLNNYFPKKSFLTKALFVYSVAVLVTAILLSVVIMHTMRKPLVNSVSELQSSLVEQVRSVSDNYVLTQINTMLTQNFLDYTKDEDWKFFFSLEKYDPQNTTKLVRISYRLSDLCTNYDFLDSVVLYNHTAKVAYSSVHGVMLPETLDSKPISYIGYDIMQEFIELEKPLMWVSPDENAALYPDTKVVSFISRVPMLYKHIPTTGCVVLNINMEKLLGYMSSVFADIDAQLMIIDEKEKVLAATDYDSINTDIDWLLKGIAAEDGGSMLYKSTNVLWVPSSVNNWTYVTILPIDYIYKETTSATQSAIWLIAVILILSLFAVYIVTKWINKPIRQLVAKLSSNMQLESEIDEIRSIDNMIDNLINRVSNLESTLVDNKELLENQIVMEILSYNVVNANEIYERLELINIPFKKKDYILVFVELSSDVLENMEIEKREVLYLDTVRNLKQYFSRSGECLSMRHNKYIVFVVAADEKDSIYEGLPEISINMNVGICPSVNDISMLHKMFQNIDVYMQYKFIYGFGNVFTPDFVEKHEKSEYEISTELLVNIEEYLKQNYIDNIKSMLQNMEDEIKNNNCSLNHVHSFLMQIAFLVCSIAKEQGIESNEFSNKKLIAEFYGVEYLHDFMFWIESVLDIYANRVNKRDASTTYKFINSIVEYIDTHIDDTLSLKSVAESFGISANYLSRIFRETLNVHFSVYVNNKKYDYVAKMLVENENMKVSQIAEKIGYYNMPYFNQQFKKRFGMTPLQYRKINTKKSK